MRKKIIPIFFILLANIIVLGHAFIPHHHHHREVCIVKSHCQNDSESHKHNNTNPSHQHDGDNNTEVCVLKLFFVVPTNHAKPEFKFPKSNNNSDHTFSFQAVQHELMILCSDQGNKIFSHPLFAKSVYLFDTVNGIGLRAPPVV